MNLSYEEEQEAIKDSHKAERDRINEDRNFQAALAIFQAAVSLRAAYDRDGAIKEAIEMYKMIRHEGF